MEWVVITNTGNTPFHTRNVSMTVGQRGTSKKYVLGVITPGFVLQPGAKMRMCTGNPATEVHGTPPEETDDLKNYFLLRKHTYVKAPGTVLTLLLHSLQITKAEFDPTTPTGVRQS